MIRSIFSLVLLALSITGVQAADTAYISPQDIDLTRILAPPPGPDSPGTQEDLRVLLELQAKRTPQMVAEAQADAEITLSRFSDAVGTDLSRTRAPRANALIDKVRATVSPIVGYAKTFWQRPRPYVLFPQVQLVLPSEKSYAYPSGHTAYGMSTAIVLANMVPEKAGAIFARGRQYGWNRAVGGVHYPSDVDAGRLAGTAIMALILRSPAFQEDLKLARAEIRGLLGLPLESAETPAASGAPILPAAAAPAR